MPGRARLQCRGRARLPCRGRLRVRSSAGLAGLLFARRLTHTAHALFEAVLRPGDDAVDLTAGNGNDTLAMARIVTRANSQTGERGHVLAMDIQREAVAATQARVDEDLEDPDAASHVHIVQTCHANVRDYLRQPGVRHLRLVAANLGYLPGSCGDVYTRADSTITALRESLEHIERGGVACVLAYPQATQGDESELDAVANEWLVLPAREWHVVRIEHANRTGAPVLLAAYRIAD